MYRYAVAALCLIGVVPTISRGQKSTLEPLSLPSGTIVTFHVQARLNPGAGESDSLPKGATLNVRLLAAVDSAVNEDGSPFHGELVAPVFDADGKTVLVPAHAQAEGILVLLRSRNHPDGFRYELLLIRITDHGRELDLTASLNPSLTDTRPNPSASDKQEPLASGKTVSGKAANFAPLADSPVKPKTAAQ